MNGSHMMDWGNDGYGVMGYGWMIFGWIFMILFWTVIILLIVWLYKQIKGPEAEPTVMEETSLEILKKRYARGEIDKKEYEEKKKDLE